MSDLLSKSDRKLLDYVFGMMGMAKEIDALTNEDLARWLFVETKDVPLGGIKDDMFLEICERLSPGVIERIAEGSDQTKGGEGHD